MRFAALRVGKVPSATPGSGPAVASTATRARSALLQRGGSRHATRARSVVAQTARRRQVCQLRNNLDSAAFRSSSARYGRHMGRHPRLNVSGVTYHVTARGNDRAAIVRNDIDRTAFVQQLASVTEEHHWRILSYCLMNNHYHLLLQTTAPTLSQGMRQLNGVFAQRFNRRYRRVGHLFQGRFSARFVQTDAHLLGAIRYIARNPVAAGLCRDPGLWRWSSHRALLGLEPPWFVDVGTTLAYFTADRERARVLYRAHVEDVPDQVPGHQLVDEEMELVVPGLPRRSARPPRPALAALFASSDRDAGIGRAVECGYSLREIARHLGVNASTVSRRSKRCRREVGAGAATART